MSATNKDLAKEIAEGNFREDLFYRLSVVPISVPSLKDRRADVGELAQLFLDNFLSSAGKARRLGMMPLPFYSLMHGSEMCAN